MKNVLPVFCGRAAAAALWICLAWGAVAQQPVNTDALVNPYPAPVTVTNQFGPPPTPPVLSGPTTPGTGQAGAPSMGTSALAGSSASVSRSEITGPPLVSWGPIGVYPHLLYRFTYGDGVAALPGENTTTEIETVAPGLLLALGNHWTLDYTPTLAFYSSRLFKDTVDQAVLLHGATTNGDWVLGLAQSYVSTTQPLVETGTQTEQEGYATAFTAAGQLSAKLSLELGLNQIFRFSQSYPSMHEWSTADWLNYQIEPQLGLALGPTIGYDELSAGSDMPFEQIRGRVTFRSGTKLLLSVDGGVEDRQFIHPSSAAMVTPVFNASAFYQIFEGTALSVLGSRVVTPSLYVNQAVVISTVSASLRQHLVKEIYLEIDGGYTTEPFTSIEPGPLPEFFLGAPPRSTQTVVRTDTTEFGKISLSTTFRKRLTGSVFYYASKNASSQVNFSYKSTQTGVELSYHY